MDFLEGITSGIKSGIRTHFEKRKEQKDFIDKLNFEAQVEQKRVFEEEFRRGAREVAIAKAKKDAANLSGIQKMRAENRLRRLNEHPGSGGTFFDRLREHTQKNLANREENLKRTEMMRGKAKEEKEKQMQERKVRNPGMNQPTFGNRKIHLKSKSSHDAISLYLESTQRLLR